MADRPCSKCNKITSRFELDKVSGSPIALCESCKHRGGASCRLVCLLLGLAGAMIFMLG